MANIAVQAARDTVLTTGKRRDKDVRSLVFLGVLWFSLFFGVLVLLVLLIDTAIIGAPRFDSHLLGAYYSQLFPDQTGFRAGLFGSLWLMVMTALLSIPLGIASALYLEEFANKDRWYNKLIEVNLQNLAAVPSVVYGLLAVAALSMIGVQRSGIVIGGAIALTLLILPVIIITTREAVRAVPREIRDGSLALGATVWQTTWKQTLPSAIPGIATGTILGLSRAIGEAAPLLLLGAAVGISFVPNSPTDPFTAMPIQLYSMTSLPDDAYKTAVSAGIIVLLIMILGLNAIAIFIRNKFQRTW